MTAKADLYFGDCLEILPTLEDNSVDAVITDPPYATKFLHLWEPLAEQSARVLKDGGLLFTLAGQFALDKIIASMSKHMEFWWIGGMPNKHGTVALNHSRQVMCSWKPVLWYCKGKARKHDWVFDLFESKRITRSNHKWEQSLGWFEYYVDKLTEPESIILDPFMGSGTTGVACMNMLRNFIGIEIEEKYYITAEQRVRHAEKNAQIEEKWLHKQKVS